MRWIGTWSKIDDKKKYIVVPRGSGPDRLVRPMPEAMFGWEAKRLIEGTYVATEFLPPASVGEIA